MKYYMSMIVIHVHIILATCAIALAKSFLNAGEFAVRCTVGCMLASTYHRDCAALLVTELKNDIHS